MSKHLLLLTLFHVFPPAVQVQFNPTSYAVPEGETAMLRVELNGASEIDIVVRFTTQDGSAQGIAKRGEVLVSLPGCFCFSE